MSDSILMSYAEVSALTGIPVNTLKDYRSKGSKGPISAVIGGHVRYRRADVNDWINRQFEQSGKGGKPVNNDPVFTPLGCRRNKVPGEPVLA